MEKELRISKILSWVAWILFVVGFSLAIRAEYLQQVQSLSSEVMFKVALGFLIVAYTLFHLNWFLVFRISFRPVFFLVGITTFVFNYKEVSSWVVSTFL